MTAAPVALITGASRGIGRAVARQLAQHGYHVAINFVRSRDLAESLLAELTDAGCTATLLQGDVGSAEDRRRMVHTCSEQFGRLDLLVNNAGITSPGRRDLLEASEDSWDLVMDTNLKGPFFLSQLAARVMVRGIAAGTQSRGVIVNVSSISAYAVSANRGDYCIAKAGLEMMTWLFAERLASEKIWVYEVCPGVVESDMTQPVKEKYDKLIAEGLTPIRRWGKPQDVANVVRILTDPGLSFCTGQRIHVDGGFHIRRL